LPFLSFAVLCLELLNCAYGVGYVRSPAVYTMETLLPFVNSWKLCFQHIYGWEYFTHT